MSGLIGEMKRVVASVIDGDEHSAALIVFALIKEFGGEALYVPKDDYRHRNAEIKSLYNAGASIEHLAKRFHLSERTIYRIINAD